MNTYIAIVSSSNINETESGLTCDATLSFERIVDSSDAPMKCWIAFAAPRDNQANFKIVGLLSGLTLTRDGAEFSADLKNAKWDQSFGMKNGIDTCPHNEIQQTLHELMDGKGPGKALRLGVNTERKLVSVAAFEKELRKQDEDYTKKLSNPAAYYPTTNIRCPKCSSSTAYIVNEQQTVTRTLTHGRYRKDGGIDERYNSEFSSTKWMNRKLMCSSCRHRWDTREKAGCLAVVVAMVSAPLMMYLA